MKDKDILTAESVTEGHPDKLCGAIASSVLENAPWEQMDRAAALTNACGGSVV